MTTESKANGGVEISGGNVSAENIAGRDLIQHLHEAPTPRIAALHQLPTPPGDFTGREAELSELREAILQGGAHISALQGQGGVGKTALALTLAAELASHFPDAQIYLDLKGVSERPVSPAEALAHVVRSFHPEDKLPEKEEELKGHFTSVLHDKRVLLFVDNARDATQVQPLIPPAKSALIVTSRTTFTLKGLKQKRLNTLPPKDANELLMKIAPRIGGAADAIAKACGYLPLALRLAATAIAERVDLDPLDYSRELANQSKRLSLLQKGAGDPSVEASIRLSYNLLECEIQQRWRMLSVFPDRFNALAAAAVWEVREVGRNEVDAARDALSRLLRLSMLEWDAAVKRYRLHDLTRDFARAECSEAEREAALAQHSKHYLRLVGHAADLYEKGGESVMRGLALFDVERVNIEAGQNWAARRAGNNPEAQRLCSSYANRGMYLFSLRFHPRRMVDWLESGLAAAQRAGDRRAEQCILGNLGLFLKDARELGRAVRSLEEALAIARELSDRKSEAGALVGLGLIYNSLDEPRRAVPLLMEGLAILRALGDRSGESTALANLGVAHSHIGEYRRAILCEEESLQIAREQSDKRNEAAALGMLGANHLLLGEYDLAVGYLEQQLEMARHLGDQAGEEEALGNLGNAYDRLGDPRRAIEYHEQALSIDREVGNRMGEGQELHGLGNAYRSLGEYRRAIEFYKMSLAIKSEIGDRSGVAISRFNMSVVLNELGERRQAIADAEAALKIFEQIGHPHAVTVRGQLESWRREA